MNQHHPVFNLALKGVQKWPNDANLINSAAVLVARDGVILYSDDVATVTSQSTAKTYALVNGRCTCEGYRFKKKCSHHYAERLARKLEQPYHADPDAAFSVKKEHDRQVRAHQAQQRNMERKSSYNKWYNSGRGKRQYVRKAMANGATKIRSEIYDIAYEGQVKNAIQNS